MVNCRSTTAILQKLRALMRNTKYVSEPLNAYIVPSEDRHQNEYIGDCDCRREFISGFSGSMGTAIVTEKDACMWTDGRYYLQATQEMDENWTLMKRNCQETPSEDKWLCENLPPGSRVGADPWLMCFREWQPLQTQLENAGLYLVPVSTNLIDIIWENRPQQRNNIIQPHPLQFTGKTCKEKIEDVRKEMKKKSASLLLVTALDEIAWVLNLRGSDIEYNPLFYAYLMILHNSVHMFVDESKVTSAVRDHFNQENLAVTYHPYEKLESFFIDQIPQQEGKIWVYCQASYALLSLVPKKQCVSDISPISLMKTLKNPTEISGFLNCHIRDGAAVCCYLAWLEKEVSKGTVTEVTGAQRLEEFRKEMDNYVGLSFPTISCVGAHGSQIHFRPSKNNDRVINTEELYLCDSGAQYKDGTTDITRTVHFGTPTDFEKECFTRVFKGQVFMATCIFPERIKGHYLDTLARKYLWDVGLDYLHGTSHGIGSYLNVHEAPVSISWRTHPDDPGLCEGMFLSNEPGYYEDNKFGIRLENIVRVVPAKPKHGFGQRKFLTFETVDLVPIQTKMLVPELLTEKEIAHLNAYHLEVREKVGPLLKKMGHHEAREWLYRETEPIG